MPRLGLRWRTQRIAISNANCRIPWIIRFLNVLYAPGYSWEHVWSQRLLNLSCPPEFRTSSLERANLCTSELLSKLATDAWNISMRLTSNLIVTASLFTTFTYISLLSATFTYIWTTTTRPTTNHQPPTNHHFDPKNNFIKEIANKSATGVHLELPSLSRLRRRAAELERYGFSNYEF